jgi:hypothetical protein
VTSRVVMRRGDWTVRDMPALASARNGAALPRHRRYDIASGARQQRGVEADLSIPLQPIGYFSMVGPQPQGHFAARYCAEGVQMAAVSLSRGGERAFVREVPRPVPWSIPANSGPSPTEYAGSHRPGGRIAAGPAARWSPDAATMIMLRTGLATWEQSDTAGRAACRPREERTGAWTDHAKALAGDDRLLAPVDGGYVVLRETMRMLGAHLRRDRVSPEGLVPIIRRVVGERLRALDTCDRSESEAVLRDAVTWGIQGYYADVQV